MEAIKLDEVQILTEAWNRYIENYSKGWSWKDMYHNVEVEARNEAIRQIWRENANAKIGVETADHNANYIAGPARYYEGNRYNGD